MRKLLLSLGLFFIPFLTVCAQRHTDKLDRGLVAIQTGASGNSKTNLVTWRRLASEYYDVKYNLYKNGSKLASNLTTTCYDDNSNGLATTTYQVAAVVGGVEQEKSEAFTPWNQYVYQYSVRCPTGYLDIPLATVYDRDGNDVTANYSPNDAEMADLDGDGQLEIIVKRLNTVDASAVYLESSRQFAVIDAYDVDWQTGAASLLWRIDCGPNMVSLNSTEINIIVFDWDEDGKAEVVLRGADNMIIFGGDGKTVISNIGNMSVNTRNTFNPSSGSQYAWTHTGAEYLLYLNGQTGEIYQKTDFPLKRLESGETDLKKAWGDNYGHRSSKYFFGAPFLDGRKASLFLGRGIYTRHKFIAMDLDRGSHQWQELWRWNCNDKNSPWYGNGYHNFVVADVDEDGRDEIVYGSMVIDDNGKGLSTSGFEHGDAQHVSDFDPYRKGLEFFGCLEDGPYYGCNYRNATTGEVYFKHTSTSDDGRALMANFSNDYPGSIGRSSSTSGMINSLRNATTIPAYDGDTYIAWGDLNARIYWDGDLCSEILNSPGTAKEAKVDKPGTGRLFTSSGCNMNNDSKNNPCFQGDIIGDWREEIVVRCGTNLRVYTSGMSTNYSLPTLWNDHQYRQAMVWQMMAYNQPPHLSYFLGEMEGITQAPPTLTMDGREEIANGSAIGSGTNGQTVILCETNDMTVSVADGASPSVVFVNAPTWVQGTDENGTTGTKVKTDGSIGATNLPAINTDTYTHTLTGGAFSGNTRLVKQGDGVLVLPKVTETYKGNTDVWAGTLRFDGIMQSSAVWLNRFATLVTDGGQFQKGVTADYASSIIPGEGVISSISTTTLTLNFGSRIVIDFDGNSLEADQVNAGTLVIGTKTGDVWKDFGPEYLTPVMVFNLTGNTLGDGAYKLGTVNKVTGSLDDIRLEGLDNLDNPRLELRGTDLMLLVGTGVTPVCSEAVISESGWQANGQGILLPKVSIASVSFDYKDAQTLPLISATFADLDGNKCAVDFTLFSEDFEGSTNAADYWENNNNGSSIFTPNYAGSEGQCVGIKSSNDRGDYVPISVNYEGLTSYVIEFDAYFNDASKTTDFAVMSKSHFGSWTYNYGYKWKNNSTQEHNPYLLFLQRAPASTTFAVNETDETLTLSNSTWYHFTLNVNITTGTVDYRIAPKGTTSVVASGSYVLPEGESAECDGIYIRNGRYAYSPGGAGIDNIVVKAYSYTFTQPGTLTVTSSYPGCTSAETAFTADKIGVEVGATGYATLGCGYPLDLDVEDLEAYVVESVDGNSVKLAAVSSVPSGTGLLLKGTPATAYRLPVSASEPSGVGDNLLVAVTSDYVADGSNQVYVLAKKKYGVGFCPVTQGVTIPAGKAYLRIEGGNSREYFPVNGESTAITTLAVPAASLDGPVYDLQGRRVMRPSKGVYLMPSGRKVIIVRN